MANGVWKGIKPLVIVIWRSDQLSINRLLNQSTPCMRNIDKGGKKWGEEITEK